DAHVLLQGGFVDEVVRRTDHRWSSRTSPGRARSGERDTNRRARPAPKGVTQETAIVRAIAPRRHGAAPAAGSGCRTRRTRSVFVHGSTGPAGNCQKGVTDRL